MRMRTTERIRPAALASESVRNLPVVLLSLFIAIAAVDVLLVTQPTFVHSLRDSWQSLLVGGVDDPWPTVLGAAASVACAAVAAAVLTVVVRGIVEAPYLWLASALVSGCSLAIARMTVQIPLGLPTPVFAGMSALLLVGGGAFLQGRSTLLHVTGTFLAAIPLALLAFGYMQGRTSTGAEYDIDHAAQLLLGTLAIASVGTMMIALASRRLHALGGSAALGTPSPEQMAELIERTRASELRAAEAEYRLHLVRDGDSVPHLDDAYEITRMRGSSFGRFAFWALVLLGIGGGAFGFFARYLPLQQQLASQQKLNHTLTEQHAAAVAKLRADFDREREALQRPVQAPEPAPAAAPIVAPNTPVAAPPRSEVQPIREVRPPEPATRKVKPTEHASAPASAPAASKSQPAAQPAGQHEPAKQTRSPVSKSDDPLEGLDGM
jgi:hypothetical protein